jgi:hypothetical protein
LLNVPFIFARPHADLVPLLRKYESGIKANIENPKDFDKFIRDFERTNFGERVVRNWNGDLPMKKVVDGVTKFAYKLHSLQSMIKNSELCRKKSLST